MAENAEDLGEPVAYLVLKKGVPVYTLSGDNVGRVGQVLADEREDVFHGLLIDTPDGRRFAAGDQVAGLYERGAIVTEPAERLARPGDNLPAGRHESSFKRAWDWLVQPR
ncbi:PRC-barrel domain-containing protein [Actinoplanes sp. HUAS TT8]|uniref:PRC-barrel domain-containing protein n=1 Tax=Actinoplanes sp. HUAS TT8 TaxID=3447453 RepID=UPI003F5239C8